MSSRVSFFLFACVALAPLSAVAQSADRDAPIVVTGTRLPTALDAATAPVSVLTAADLERRQTVFLADALATLPGVTISRNGAFGGQTSLRVRGASSQQTLVLIDGVAVNDPSGPAGGFDAGALDAADIARVEVLRGPQSTLWGSDAIGGVVSIITRAPEPGVSGRAFAEGGSYGTVRGGGGINVGAGAFAARLGGVVTTSDGISKADARDGNPEKDGYDAHALDGRARYAVSPAVQVDAFARYAHSKTDTDSFGFVTGVTDGPDRAEQTERSGGVSARFGAEDARLTQRVTLAAADIDRTSFTTFGDFPAKGARTSARYEGQARLGGNVRTAFGAERERTSVRGSGASTVDGLFALAEIRPADTLTLTAGVRRDDHSRFGDVTTTRLGVRYAPVPAFGLRASWGEGFKAPSIFQLLGDGVFVAPNPNLRPERAKGWDVALFGAWLDGRASGEIGYFSLKSRDLISFGTVGYVNVARAESTGVEASGRIELRDDLSLDASYTQTDATDATTGAKLLRVPERSATLEADWRATPRLGLTLIGRHVGETRDLVVPANPRGRIAAWSRLDAAARYQLTPKLELYARIENVTDEAYQEVFGYGTPGRSAYAGVRVRFE
ncbi:MAG: TonB-dependent receptor [Alphaproteobacteria bacterium]|nr:TonB-dependent receptor [Alphaproteobacteria bacterium]